MMTTVAIQNRFVEALTTLGDLDTAVNLALQRYAIEQITAKMSELRTRSKSYQEKYGMDYLVFTQRLARDANFIVQIEANVSKTWELDLADWEFCHRGIEDWTRKLQSILLP